MAKTKQVPTRRFLFLHPARKGTLAPIYVALLGLMALGVFGLFVAVWPRDAGPSAQRPVDPGSAPESRSFEGSYRPPPSSPKPRNPSTWM
jgi:hypothetical protein